MPGLVNREKIIKPHFWAFGIWIAKMAYFELGAGKELFIPVHIFVGRPEIRVP